MSSRITIGGQHTYWAMAKLTDSGTQPAMTYIFHMRCIKFFGNKLCVRGCSCIILSVTTVAIRHIVIELKESINQSISLTF